MRKFWISIVLVVLIIGCAKRGTITGGEKDILPPEVLSSNPKDLSTNFNQNTIKITFNEFVKIKDLQKNLIVSPPFEKPITILPQGSASKTLTIKISDSLVPNTTYCLNFGESIIDNNEGNALKNFKYVFSTGKELDSLTLEGTIKDAYEKEVPNFVNVMLYEANEKFNDSTIYKQVPRYITNTLDSSSTFKISNIKAGKYILVALKEKSSNYKFDAKKDKIGFYNQTITIPDKAIFDLELFKEEPVFTVKKPTQASGNRVLLGYDGNPSNVKINVLQNNQSIWHKVTKFPEKDSLQIWVKPLKNDSLFVTVNHPKLNKDYVVKFRNFKNDSLKLNSKSNTLRLNENPRIQSDVPLEKFDFTKMKLIKKDSSLVNFKTNYDEFNQELELLFEKEENQKYTFSLEPNSVEDYLGQKNDSIIKFTFNTKNKSDYGNLKLDLKNIKNFPVIVELTNSKGNILYTEYTDKNSIVEFLLIEPQKYSVRVIYDSNNNKKWDTGSYIENRQPEEVFHFTTEIDVRANWDVNQDIDMSK